MELTQRKGAIAVGGVTLVVLAGAVTWNAFARTEEAGVGETLRMDTADPQPVIMTAAQQQALRERLASQNVSPTPVPPAPATVPPAQLYASQLSLMSEMGFADADANLRALVATGGNLDAAIQQLEDQGLA